MNWFVVGVLRFAKSAKRAKSPLKLSCFRFFFSLSYFISLRHSLSCLTLSKGTPSRKSSGYFPENENYLYSILQGKTSNGATSTY